MTRKNNLWLLLSACIVIVFIWLRFAGLTDSCLWFDEIFSVHAAEFDWNNLLWFVAQDLIHPPFFYVLLKFWILLGGENLFWLRSFPVLFSIVSLIPFYFLCRRLKLTYSEIALALTFFAFNGALIKYAQEVRMYSVLLCLSLFSIWLFLRFLDLGKNIWILTIINFLLIYTHYFGWFVILAEIAAILFLQRIKIRQILIMFGILLLSYVPWILTIWQAAKINADLSQNIGWIEKPNLRVLSRFALTTIEPFYYQQTSIDSYSNYLVSIPILLIFAAAIIFYLTNWKSENETERRNFVLLLIFIKLPVIVAVMVSWIFPFSIFGARHLIIIFVPTAILLSVVLNRIKISPLKYSFLAVLAVVNFGAFSFQLQKTKTQFIWCAWENLAQNLDRNQPQKVYVFEDLVAYHFWFAVRDSEKIQVAEVKNIPEMVEDKAYFLPRGFEVVKITDENGFEGDEFWVAFRDMEFNEKHPPINLLLEKGYKIGELKEINAGGLKAFLVKMNKPKN